MVQLKLKRELISQNSTVGRLYVDDVYYCDTLEPTNRMIPTGRYEVKYTYSPRFKTDLPILLNVPHRSGIRIHSGNIFHDSQGCILVGEQLHNEFRLLASRLTLESLCECFESWTRNGHDIWITIL